MNPTPYSGTAFRQGVGHFLTGKALSALLTFAALLWLARLLPRSEYGVYATLIGSLELGYLVAGIGLPWLAARHLPDYRLNAPGQALQRLCRRLLVTQTLALAVLAAGMLLALDPYLRWADLQPYRSAVLLALAVMLLDGMGRFYREAVMTALMLQRAARLSIVSRQLMLLSVVGAAVLAHEMSLVAALVAEAAASAGGLALAAWHTRKQVHALAGQAGRAGWVEGQWRSQWTDSARMYVAQLLTLPCSPQLLLNLVQRYVGLDAAAVFGFLRNLQQLIGRYLPATLLVALIRPKLIASAVVVDGADDLIHHAGLAAKLNLFVLAPLLCIAAVEGEAVVALLSGHHLQQTGLVFFGFLLALVPSCQRQILETVAVATGNAKSCVHASYAALLSLPLTVVLLHFGAGIWGGVAGLVAGQALFVLALQWRLRRGVGYRIEWRGPVRLAAAGAIAVAAGATASHFAQAAAVALGGGGRVLPWATTTATALATALVFLLVAAIAKPFTTSERQRINAFVGRRVFVW